MDCADWPKFDTLDNQKRVNFETFQKCVLQTNFIKPASLNLRAGHWDQVFW